MPICLGRADQNAHPQETMVFVKSWEIKGKNQKKPMVIELWKCPQCGRVKRTRRKD